MVFLGNKFNFYKFKKIKENQTFDFVTNKLLAITETGGSDYFMVVFEM